MCPDALMHDCTFSEWELSAVIAAQCQSQDITVGTWMLGLDVDFVNERRLCCANADECQKQVCLDSVHGHPGSDAVAR